MQTLCSGRFAIGIAACAALLAGCGGGSAAQLNPLHAGHSTVFGGTTAERAHPGVTYGVLYSFKGSSGDGSDPYAPLTKVKGTLYGTTYKGSNGSGTVYSITPSGKETVLHSFGSSGDGRYPFAGVINVKGTLYGTTVEGGTNGDGTVYSITPSGTEAVLHSFGSSGDGSHPYAGLVNVKGTLYGTTVEGGANGDGTVFSLKP